METTPPPLTAETFRRLRDLRISPRSEFETTAQYQQRFRDAADAAFSGRSPLRFRYAFRYAPDPAFIRYDADQQRMEAPGAVSIDFAQHDITFTDGLGLTCPVSDRHGYTGDPAQRGCVSLRRTVAAIVRTGAIPLALPPQDRNGVMISDVVAQADSLVVLGYEESRTWDYGSSYGYEDTIQHPYRFNVPLAAAPSTKANLVTVVDFIPVAPYVREGYVTVRDRSKKDAGGRRVPFVLYVGRIAEVRAGDAATGQAYFGMRERDAGTR